MLSKLSVKYLQNGSRTNYVAAAIRKKFNDIMGLQEDKLGVMRKKSDKQISEKDYTLELARPQDNCKIKIFMENNYFSNDSLCKSLQIGHKNLDQALEIYLSEALLQGMTLVAREKSLEKNILGVCINQRSCKFDGDQVEKLSRFASNKNATKLLLIWALLAREPAMHDHLSQLSIFELKFLSAKNSLDAKFKQILALKLAESSMFLGSDLNYNYARMNCTDDFLRNIAEKLEMEKLFDVRYRNILSHDGKPATSAEENSHANVCYIDLKSRSNEIIKIVMNEA